MDFTPLYKQLRDEIVDIVKTRKIEVDDAFTLIVIGIQILIKYKTLTGQQKHDILVNVLEDIAKGKDGVFGTADDLIPEKVWKQIETLLSSEIVNSAIKVCYSLVTGKFPNVIGMGFQAFNCFQAMTGALKKK